MNPNLMRFLDKWIGIPICFILSIFNLFRKKKVIINRNVLFVELIEMGSTIMAYPAIKEIKKCYDPNIFFLIFEENKKGVELLDVVPKENIITIRTNSIINLIFDTFKFMYLCRKYKIDTIINLELFTRIGTILSYLSGAKNIAGFYRYTMEGLYMGNLQTHNIIYNPYIHISQNYITLIKSLLSQSKSHIQDIREFPKAGLKNKNILKKFKLKKPFIIVSLNASELLPQRAWPIINYYDLISRILEYNKKIRIALIGTEEEHLTNENMRTLFKHNKIINLAGKTTLDELVDLCHFGKMLICNDSGPAHFAALTKIKKVVFFGPETPILYKPFGDTIVFYSNFTCSPCVSAYNQRKTICKSNVCLQAIKPEEVFRKIKRYLK